MRVLKITACAAIMVTFGTTPMARAQAAPQWKIVHWYFNDAQTARFNDVAATGAKDAWAIGDDGRAPRLEHHDGSTWSPVQGLPVAAEDGSAYPAIGATGPRDVWFFGHQGTRGLAEQWDGTRWRTHELGTRRVADAKVLSATDVWVGGNHTIGHYDGRRWSFRTTGITVNAVGAASAKDVWFAGSYQGRAALLHWNGKRYTRTFVPAIKAGKYTLKTVARDVAAFSAENVWAVGEASRFDGRTGAHSWPITLHWDGRRWKVVRLTAEESLRSVAADGHGGLWASGGASMYRYAKGRWTRVELPRQGILAVHVNGLANVRGTGRVWAAATINLDDPPEFPTAGGLLTYG